MNQISNLTQPLKENKKTAKLRQESKDSITNIAGIAMIYKYALFIFCVLLILLSSLWYNRYSLAVIVFPIVGLILVGSSFLLLKKRYYTAAKYLLAIFPPYIFTLSSAVAKSEGITANALMYLIPNLMVVFLSITPIMFFGYFKRKQLFISFLFLIPLWLFFGAIHRFFGVNFIDLPYYPSYYQAIILLFTLFFVLIFYSIINLQKINFISKIQLKQNIELIEREKSNIEELNEEMVMQSNLYKILAITSGTRDLNYILNEVLIQILQVKKLHLKEKGLIFLKNKDGNLNIAAHHNVDALITTCAEIKPNECLCGKALVNKRSIFCNQVGHKHDIQPPGMKPHGHYVEPILSKNGDVIGIINVYINPLEKKEKSIAEFLKAVAHILSVKITNIRYHENLLEQKRQIEIQRNIITETYSSLIDSLEYAESLQKSLLPTKKELDTTFTNHFVIYLPKDKVSGDFYFSKKTKTKICFGVGDCTGHGIPGAILAANSIENLKTVLFYNQESKPNDILEIIRLFNEKRFANTERVRHNDSMDAALCEYNFADQKLYYSGGFIDLIIIRHGNLIIKKATRNPIGMYPKKELFELHTISLQPDDRIYLFSDGICDQFGYHGDDNTKKKKLKRKIFYQWLLESSSLPFEEQRRVLMSKLQNWQQELSQTDDITVLALQM